MCPQVTLLRIQTCEQYTNCTECLQAEDPYCGWCSLEKRYEFLARHYACCCDLQKAYSCSPRCQLRGSCWIIVHLWDNLIIVDAFLFYLLHLIWIMLHHSAPTRSLSYPRSVRSAQAVAEFAADNLNQFSRTVPSLVDLL